MSFDRIAHAVSRATGRPWAFVASVALVVGWAAVGPWFGWSTRHELFINSSTTILTFWMAFLIQGSQNRDTSAIQAKLDELIRSSKAQNRFIGIEELSEEELTALREALREGRS